MILEVSQKQAYIFGSNKLRVNLLRSEQIRTVTSSSFFEEAAPGLYSEGENFVYAGGGHTVLQFASRDDAAAFGRAVSRAVMERYPQMELYQKITAYDETRTPGENLGRLSAELEKKKSRRLASFKQGDFGVEVPLACRPDGETEPPYCPDGWRVTNDIEELAGQDNFVAVIHIDGNAMGKRVQGLYASAESADWEACTARLRNFSQSIDEDFAFAYRAMADRLAAALAAEPEEQRAGKGALPVLPLRKIIGAGDDVCFVTAGSLGLEAAAAFLRALAARRNREDGMPYAACAGVALIHKKDPFRAAYDLSEELCSNAKAFGAEYDAAGRISAMDWHIEFGSLCADLAQVRRSLRTRDGNLLYLRPVAVTAPEDLPQKPEKERGYAYFCDVVRSMQRGEEGVPRSKYKELRDAMRQGRLETDLAIRQKEIGRMLELGLDARYPILQWAHRERTAFTPGQPPQRCLYFDAIEMMDHIKLWEGEA